MMMGRDEKVNKKFQKRQKQNNLLWLSSSSTLSLSLSLVDSISFSPLSLSLRRLLYHSHADKMSLYHTLSNRPQTYTISISNETNTILPTQFAILSLSLCFSFILSTHSRQCRQKIGYTLPYEELYEIDQSNPLLKLVPSVDKYIQYLIVPSGPGLTSTYQQC